MSKFFLASFVIPGAFASGSATPPNFSGTWIRDGSQSDPTGWTYSYLPEKTPEMQVVLRIKCDGTSLHAETISGDRTLSQRTIILDGKEHGYPGWGGSNWVTKSFWNGKTLVIETDYKLNTPKGKVEGKMNEEWSFSSEHPRKLTVTYIAPDGRTRNQVYIEASRK